MSSRFGFRTIDFLGVPLSVCTTSEFIRAVLDDAASPTPDRPPALVSYLNAWCSNVASRDADYRDLLRQADCVYADGQAIVWASRLLGRPLSERVNAADFILDFCREAAARKLSLYLLGSPPGVADAAAATFRRHSPELHIAGTHTGYFATEADEEHAVQRVRDSRADILILGMGVPLQEDWAARNRTRLGVRTVWCVGAMFEYHAGHRARAPVWMRRAGLEWLFRLALEPGRLWRRYVIGNSVFVARVLAAKLSRR